MMVDHDLSEYELRRFENIQRNEAILKQLGFDPRATKSAVSKVVKAEASEVTKKRRQESLPKMREKPTRKSPRLHKDSSPDHKEVEESDPEEEEDIHYDRMPFEPHELDDAEFQIYIQLRKWRLARSRELDTEAYKIFQNRTFCEFVRRKRNDPNWANPSSETFTQLTEEKKKESIVKDLLMCWGIGPRKVEENGFAFELNDRFHELDPSLLAQLLSPAAGNNNSASIQENQLSQ